MPALDADFYVGIHIPGTQQVFPIEDPTFIQNVFLTADATMSSGLEADGTMTSGLEADAEICK